MIRIIITTLGIWIAINLTTLAEIRNGYENELSLAEKSVCNLRSLSQKGFAKPLLRNFEKWQKNTVKKVDKLRDYHRRTQLLINMLQEVDPTLYYEINTIKDWEGNETDVYVRVVDDLGSNYLGITNLRQSTHNPHVHSSLYGDYSVSVMVVRSHITKALKVLVHELGHVRYQVPHLASYVKYYRETYRNQYYSSKNIGHSSSDPSHHSVLATLKEFKVSWKEAKENNKVFGKGEPKKTLVFQPTGCGEISYTNPPAP